MGGGGGRKKIIKRKKKQKKGTTGETPMRKWITLKYKVIGNKTTYNNGYSSLRLKFLIGVSSLFAKFMVTAK